MAIWVVGVGAVVLLGINPSAVVAGQHTFFGLLGAPAIRWDAGPYMTIASQGYGAAPALARFFPLYPLLMRALTLTGMPVSVAGVLIAFTSMVVAFILLQRLTRLELGLQTSFAVVELVALAPVSFYLSAVYPTGLFLALSVGTLMSARRGRWALAGVLGALAALTRVNGFVLVVPVVIIFLWGPREGSPAVPDSRGLKPRFPITQQLAWALLIPGGVAAYACYLVISGKGALSFIHAQTAGLHHALTFPLVTMAQALQSAWLQLLSGLHGSTPTIVAHEQSVIGVVALALGISALVEIWRHLPRAYFAYVVVGLLMPLSTPTTADPLSGFMRYELVLFPIYMAAANWMVRRGVKRPVLLACGVLLLVFSAQFATGWPPGSELI